MAKLEIKTHPCAKVELLKDSKRIVPYVDAEMTMPCREPLIADLDGNLEPVYVREDGEIQASVSRLVTT